MMTSKKLSIVGTIIISILFISTSYAKYHCDWPTNPVKENLSAKFNEEGNITVKAWDFQVSGENNFCYQVRYYSPGTTFCDDGYLNGTVFEGLEAYNESNPYEEEMDPEGIMVDWNVVLMKGGNTKDGCVTTSCDTLKDLTSDRVSNSRFVSRRNFFILLIELLVLH